jgi:hypothetical protein
MQRSPHAHAFRANALSDIARTKAKDADLVWVDAYFYGFFATKGWLRTFSLPKQLKRSWCCASTLVSIMSWSRNEDAKSPSSFKRTRSSRANLSYLSSSVSCTSVHDALWTEDDGGWESEADFSLMCNDSTRPKTHADTRCAC